MVQCKILIYISFMLSKLSNEHFIPPPNYCMMALICNHTSIPLCGLEQNKHCYRMFLDECDLYEYNCDNKAEYVSSSINNCNQISDSNNQKFCDDDDISIKNTIKASTTLEIITTKTSTDATTVQITAVPTATLPNITTCTKSTYKTKTKKAIEESTAIVSDIDKNNIENQTTKQTFPSVPNQTEIAEVINIINGTTTEETFDAVTMSTDNTSSNAAKTSTEVSKTNLNTVDINNTTIKPTIMESEENKEDTTTFNIEDSNNVVTNKFTDEPETTTAVIEKNPNGNLEINLNNITSNDNASSAPVLNKTNTTTQNTVYNTETVTNATVPIAKLITEIKMDTASDNCGFPSYCDRPRVWLTTIKGDTRDFYRIIKDNERYNNK